MFITTNGEKLPEEKLQFIRERLLAMDDSKGSVPSTIQFKNPTTALLLSLLLFGFDRIYIGDTGVGVGKLRTFGACGIWTIVD